MGLNEDSDLRETPIWEGSLQIPRRIPSAVQTGRLEIYEKLQKTSLASKKESFEEMQKRVLSTLEKRFFTNLHLHSQTAWNDVRTALVLDPLKIYYLGKLDASEGAPEFVWEKDDKFFFMDCVQTLPLGRRNVVYDAEAEETAKMMGKITYGNAVSLANEMRVNLVDAESYERAKLDHHLDLDTTCWVDTPKHIRDTNHALVGSLFHSAKRIQKLSHIIDPNRGWRGILSINKVK